MKNSTSQNLSISSFVENANLDQLLELLKKAEVNVGHWRGRLISVPGYSGHITFSKFSFRIEKVYQETVKPMQDKQKQYNKDTTVNIDFMPARGRGGMLLNVSLLPFTIPAKIIGNAVCWASTAYPEVSEEEEEEIAPMIEWRTKTDTEFNRLVKTSQNKIEQLAANSYKWKIIKAWDSFLNTEDACKNIHTNDSQTLNWMSENRKIRTDEQSTLDVLKKLFLQA